ncbi:3-hydroxyacyl-ACP dehydratase FabZ [Candidatus Auribacterota bacterium]
MEQVTDLLPHREPFLFVDKIISQEENKIITERKIKADEFFFKGHYPGNPIMPGVLLCEAMYQSGALLMAKLVSKDGIKGTPVVTRSNNIKYKRMVKPGDLLCIEVEFIEKMGPAYSFKGLIRVEGKVVVSGEFICAIVA